MLSCCRNRMGRRELGELEPVARAEVEKPKSFLPGKAAPGDPLSWAPRSQKPWSHPGWTYCVPN